jgi:hypothetical protein
MIVAENVKSEVARLRTISNLVAFSLYYGNPQSGPFRKKVVSNLYSHRLDEITKLTVVSIREDAYFITEIPMWKVGCQNATTARNMNVCAHQSSTQHSGRPDADGSYMSGSLQNNLTTAVDHAHAYNFSTAELSTHYLPKLPERQHSITSANTLIPVWGILEITQLQGDRLELG